MMFTLLFVVLGTATLFSGMVLLTNINSLARLAAFVILLSLLASLIMLRLVL